MADETPDDSIVVLDRLLQWMTRLDPSMRLRRMLKREKHNDSSLLPRLRCVVELFLQGLFVLRFWKWKADRSDQKRREMENERRGRGLGAMWVDDWLLSHCYRIPDTVVGASPRPFALCHLATDQIKLMEMEHFFHEHSGYTIDKVDQALDAVQQLLRDDTLDDRAEIDDVRVLCELVHREYCKHAKINERCVDQLIVGRVEEELRTVINQRTAGTNRSSRTRSVVEYFDTLIAPLEEYLSLEKSNMFSKRMRMFRQVHYFLCALFEHMHHQFDHIVKLQEEQYRKEQARQRVEEWSSINSLAFEEDNVTMRLASQWLERFRKPKLSIFWNPPLPNHDTMLLGQALDGTLSEFDILMLVCNELCALSHAAREKQATRFMRQWRKALQPITRAHSRESRDRMSDYQHENKRDVPFTEEEVVALPHLEHWINKLVKMQSNMENLFKQGKYFTTDEGGPVPATYSSHWESILSRFNRTIRTWEIMTTRGNIRYGLTNWLSQFGQLWQDTESLQKCMIGEILRARRLECFHQWFDLIGPAIWHANLSNCAMKITHDPSIDLVVSVSDIPLRTASVIDDLILHRSLSDQRALMAEYQQHGMTFEDIWRREFEEQLEPTSEELDLFDICCSAVDWAIDVSFCPKVTNYTRNAIHSLAHHLMRPLLSHFSTLLPVHYAEYSTLCNAIQHQYQQCTALLEQWDSLHILSAAVNNLKLQGPEYATAVPFMEKNTTPVDQIDIASIKEWLSSFPLLDQCGTAEQLNWDKKHPFMCAITDTLSWRDVAVSVSTTINGGSTVSFEDNSKLVDMLQAVLPIPETSVEHWILTSTMNLFQSHSTVEDTVDQLQSIAVSIIREQSQCIHNILHSHHTRIDRCLRALAALRFIARTLHPRTCSSFSSLCGLVSNHISKTMEPVLDLITRVQRLTLYAQLAMEFLPWVLCCKLLLDGNESDAFLMIDEWNNRVQRWQARIISIPRPIQNFPSFEAFTAQAHYVAKMEYFRRVSMALHRCLWNEESSGDIVSFVKQIADVLATSRHKDTRIVTDHIINVHSENIDELRSSEALWNNALNEEHYNTVADLHRLRQEMHSILERQKVGSRDEIMCDVIATKESLKQQLKDMFSRIYASEMFGSETADQRVNATQLDIFEFLNRVRGHRSRRAMIKKIRSIIREHIKRLIIDQTESNELNFNRAALGHSQETAPPHVIEQARAEIRRLGTLDAEEQIQNLKIAFSLIIIPSEDAHFIKQNQIPGVVWQSVQYLLFRVLHPAYTRVQQWTSNCMRQLMAAVTSRDNVVQLTQVIKHAARVKMEELTRGTMVPQLFHQLRLEHHDDDSESMVFQLAVHIHGEIHTAIRDHYALLAKQLFAICSVCDDHIFSTLLHSGRRPRDYDTESDDGKEATHTLQTLSYYVLKVSRMFSRFISRKRAKKPAVMEAEKSELSQLLAPEDVSHRDEIGKFVDMVTAEAISIIIDSFFSSTACSRALNSSTDINRAELESESTMLRTASQIRWEQYSNVLIHHMTKTHRVDGARRMYLNQVLLVMKQYPLVDAILCHPKLKGHVDTSQQLQILANLPPLHPIMRIETLMELFEDNQVHNAITSCAPLQIELGSLWDTFVDGTTNVIEDVCRTSLLQLSRFAHVHSSSHEKRKRLEEIQSQNSRKIRDLARKFKRSTRE